jgi:hypothetical protein
MNKSSAIIVSTIALGLAMCVPLKASAQGVSIYVGPGYPGYGAGYGGYAYPAYPRYYGGYPAYGYAYPNYGYAYPSYGGYWGQGRRVARRILGTGGINTHPTHQRAVYDHRGKPPRSA